MRDPTARIPMWGVVFRVPRQAAPTIATPGGPLRNSWRRPRTSHRFEAVYRLTAIVFEVPREMKTRAVRQSTLKAIDAILRLSGREFKAAFEDADAPSEGPLRTLIGGRLKARISKTALREVNRHLAAIENLFAAALERQSGKQTVAFTFIMNPVPPRQGS